MNKLVIKQVNGLAMLQEVCLGYIAPGHLKVLGITRQRLATMAEVRLAATGYGTLIRYELLPLSDSLAARCLR